MSGKEDSWIGGESLLLGGYGLEIVHVNTCTKLMMNGGEGGEGQRVIKSKWMEGYELRKGECMHKVILCVDYVRRRGLCYLFRK